jgi:hypothetical protein
MDTPSTARAVLVCASLHLRSPQERGGECREGGSVYVRNLHGPQAVSKKESWVALDYLIEEDANKTSRW